VVGFRWSGEYVGKIKWGPGSTEKELATFALHTLSKPSSQTCSLAAANVAQKFKTLKTLFSAMKRSNKLVHVQSILDDPVLQLVRNGDTRLDGPPTIGLLKQYEHVFVPLSSASLCRKYTQNQMTWLQKQVVFCSHFRILCLCSCCLHWNKFYSH